ncbi:MAG: bifunctional UDP-sugar hydrolase/5'-nucleotidase [Eubacteriales bacterium]|nr:bifunctional UDP-sugar hydrolase/5'-nucleotidase [Eubacteriales bacterium]
MLRKLTVFLLVFLLAFSFACKAKTAEPAVAEVTATPELTPEPALDQDLAILYTNDVHCTVDSGIGYAGVAALKQQLLDEGCYVALVDAGDAVQGDAIGTLSKGSYIIDIMNEVGYDVATPGNHEFDYGMDRFFELRDMAKFPYVSANFTDLATGEPVLEPYTMLTFNGMKVAFVGVSTPMTITSSTPAYFQDASGNFIYGFGQKDGAEGFYSTVQKAVDAALANGAAYVITLTHLGIDASTSPYTSSELIENTRGINVVIDGHSHSVVECERVKNLDGERVLLTQTGTKLNAVGMLYITKDGSISTGLITDYTEKDAQTEAYIAQIQAQFDELLNEVVAKSEVDLTIFEPGTDPAVRIVRNSETNLGDLCADAYRYLSGADIAFVNGGGVRTDLAKGDITYGAIIKVHPFGNELCMVEATGQEILDALEMGARVTPEENGGFLQVSGLSYEIHTYVPSSVKLDENNMFVSVDGEYRVKNVMVGGEPLDPSKTYTLACHNYLLKNAGDGYTMFQDNTFLLDSIMIDNQVLINYIVGGLGGVVGEEYADPHGQGRIVAVETAP